MREFWYAATDQALVWHHDPSRASALRRLARGRARSLAAAERRRRQPWDGAALERWLGRQRPRVRREPF